MVAAEAGVTLIPEMAIDRQDKAISYIPFKKPEPFRTIGMVWRKSSPKHELLEKLYELLLDVI